MNTVYLVQHNYDYLDSFEAFATRPQAVAYAERLATENAQEVVRGEVATVALEKFWTDDCDTYNGRYTRSSRDLWIRVVKVPFTEET